MIPDDHFECATCREIVFMGDLGAVFMHEHRGLTENADFDGIGPGRKIELSDEDH